MLNIFFESLEYGVNKFVISTQNKEKKRLIIVPKTYDPSYKRVIANSPLKYQT